ncbi:hypothetical protein MLD38_014304 [Melastoma candidum]|uniref:Uncharacterized protein n=1 Tax=Melastoma candidum TaxID=119954 RepID=A0ACB9RE94_9MYRT|nr:hypothetical protein MLD38_014304 [Melastoma candidum]
MENHDAKSAFRPQGLLQSYELYEYIVETSVYPREPELLKELREVTTASHPLAIMATAPLAGQMLAMLLKLIGAKRTIEIGVFTGYSLLLTALNIPDDGKIKAIDVDRDAYEIGLPVIKKAGMEHKIDFVQSEALPILDQLLENASVIFIYGFSWRLAPHCHYMLNQGEHKGSFDFAFVDGDKVNYRHYHERLMGLLRVGGVAAYDNTLWGGTVAMHVDDLPEWRISVRQSMIEFNKFIAGDTRVELCHAPIGDGMTICRRIS